MREMEAPANRGEYLRVDELAQRFDVSVEDVFNACSVVGFPVHDEHSLIELSEFTAAVKHAAVRKEAHKRRPALASAVLASAAAVLALVLGVSMLNGNSGGGDNATVVQRAASYRAQLKSTYEKTVAHNPNGSGFQTLADELEHITPPPALAKEHAALVAEAEAVATLTAPTQDPVTSTVDATTAAAVDALRQHVAELDKSLTPAP